MNRFRVSSTDGTSGNLNDNTIYYLSGPGAENKRPNIISRPKAKPTAGTAVTIQASQPQQQQQIVLTSGTGQQSIQVPVSMAVAGTSTVAVTDTEATEESEEQHPVCLPIQILDEAASVEFLRTNNAGNHQIITDASGTMTIETDDGNLMVILQNDDDDDTTTGTIAFGHEMSTADANTQIIQGVQFPTGDGDTTVEVPSMEFGGENEIPETTSYILVQMDDQGNNILVPASAFSSQVNGIPTLTHVPVRTTQHHSYSTQNVRTTQQQNYNPQPMVQERGKPFRYVLPDSEESLMKLDEGSQYILNVLPGPSQPHPSYSSKPKKEATVTKVKAPPKPRKPRQKKLQADPAPATVARLPPNSVGNAPTVTVAVISQLSAAVESTTAGNAPVTLVTTTTSGLPISTPATVSEELTNIDTSVGGLPVEVKTEDPSTEDPSLAPTQLIALDDPELSCVSEIINPGQSEVSAEPAPTTSDATGPTGDDPLPVVISTSELDGVELSEVSGTLQMVVSTTTEPTVPASTAAPVPVTVAGTATTAIVGTAAPGPSKQNVIVVCPKPSTSKDSAVNGAPKKPVEEIVVTAFGTFKCTFCFKESTVRSHLVNHINRIHKGEKPFKCKVCNVGFQYSSSLKVHEKNHTVEKPFKCDFCECAFATDSNRNLHQKTVHLIPKDSMSLASAAPKLKFECATCKKAYCSKYNLLCHRLTHVDDFTKPIVCDFCKKECKTKAILVNHVQTHKDAVGPFSCNLCDMSFTSENRLQVHKVMHKGKKKIYVSVEPVVENQTPKTIKVNLAQRKNMKISTPASRKKKEKVEIIAKNIDCSFCDGVFPSVVALELHKKKKHGPESPARTYSKRDSDQYETYIGKNVAKKLQQEKAGTSPKIIIRKAVEIIKTAPKVVIGGKNVLTALTPDKAKKEIEEGVAKRGPGRPKKSESPTITVRGRARPQVTTSQTKKSTATKKVGGRGGRGKRRGRPSAKIQISISSESDDSEDDSPTPEKKPQVQVKETSPKEKLSKPIKKRPIRTDPISEPTSSREPSPIPETPTTDDSFVRKSQRKRGKNPYLEELKKKREKKLKAKQQKEKESLKRGVGVSGDLDVTPAKRKRMISITPKKDDNKLSSPSPKKNNDDEDIKPLVGSSRGGRKRKLMEVVVVAAIPKKRPYPKEIQELIAGSNETKITSSHGTTTTTTTTSTTTKSIPEIKMNIKDVHESSQNNDKKINKIEQQQQKKTLDTTLNIEQILEKERKSSSTTIIKLSKLSELKIIESNNKKNNSDKQQQQQQQQQQLSNNNEIDKNKPSNTTSTTTPTTTTTTTTTTKNIINIDSTTSNLYADIDEEMSQIMGGDNENEMDIVVGGGGGLLGGGGSSSSSSKLLITTAEDSGPSTSTSTSSEGGQDDERVDTSIPMKKRKVIHKTDRDRDKKDVDKDEVGKSFFKIFKQVKKDYHASSSV